MSTKMAILANRRSKGHDRSSLNMYVLPMLRGDGRDKAKERRGVRLGIRDWRPTNLD
jgi:hypothetical protein